MKLYNYWRSSSSWRVRIALAYKGIPYEYVPVHLLREGGEQFRPDHLQRNPMGQVPVLEVGGGLKPAYIPQSMAIIEYLEEVYPQPALLPKDPCLRAAVRAQAEIINSGVQPYQGLAICRKVEALGGSKSQWIREWVSAGLGAFEASVGSTHGRYCAGDRVTFADCFLVPQLFAARRFSVPLDGLPLLLEIERACMELEAFQVSHPEHQPDAEK